MTSPRKPGVVLPGAVALTVLLGLYVGAYYAMVEPTATYAKGVLFPPNIIPVYRVKANWYLDEAGWVFAPIHWLDRRLRPEIWEPDWQDP
jgi:hypothetical protein